MVASLFVLLFILKNEGAGGKTKVIRFVDDSEIYDMHVSKKGSEQVAKYLDNINFWTRGVSNEANNAVIGKLTVILTDEEQAHGETVVGEEEKEIYKSSFSIKGEEGILKISPVVKTKTGENEDKLEYLDFYILNQIYKIAYWPSVVGGKNREDYQEKKAEFVGSYLNNYGNFITQ